MTILKRASGGASARLVRPLGCLLLLAMVLSACSSGGQSASPTSTSIPPTPTPTPIPEPTAQEIVDKAREAMPKAKSLHFRFESEKAATRAAGGLEINSLEGDVIRPDKVQTDFKGKLLGVNADVRVVRYENETFITNIVTRRWEPATGLLEAIPLLRDPIQLPLDILAGLKNPTKDGKETIDGVETYRLKADASSDLLAPVTGVTGANLPVKVTIWIDSKDFRVRLIRMEGKLAPDEADGLVRTLRLTRFDQIDKIDKPVVGQTAPR